MDEGLSSKSSASTLVMPRPLVTVRYCESIRCEQNRSQAEKVNRDLEIDDLTVHRLDKSLYEYPQPDARIYWRIDWSAPVCTLSNPAATVGDCCAHPAQTFPSRKEPTKVPSLRAERALAVL